MMSMAPFDLDFKYMGFPFTYMACVVPFIVNPSSENSFSVLLEGVLSFVLLLIKIDPDPLNIL